MSLAPIGRLNKNEIVWLSRHRCKHSHTFLEHYNCYVEENPNKEKIAFFDIEASNLNANFGIILCYCLKVKGSKEIVHRTITKKEIETCLDEEVVKQCVKDLSKFDKVIGFYSKRFDMPFVRTRAVAMNIPFFNYGELLHEDLYFNVKYKFKLHSNRLENACRILVGESDKTHLDPKHWIKALQGNKKALDYILDHCKKDVVDLEKLYNKIYQYTPKINQII